MNLTMRPIMKAGAVLTAVFLFIMVSGVVLHLRTGGVFGGIASVIAVLCCFALAVAVSHLRLSPTVFMVALGATMLLFFACVALWAKTQPTSDFGVLLELAEALKDGRTETLRSSAYLRRWGYQSFFVMYEAAALRIFPGGQTSLLILNAIWMTGVAEFVYLIARRMGSEKSARCAAVLYLLYPAHWMYAPVLTNQHISLFFLLWGIYVLLLQGTPKLKNALLGGVLLAVGNALRSDGVLLMLSVAALSFLFWVSQRDVKKALTLLSSALSYIVTGLLISGIVILGGVNPNGQRNSDPLWKYVLGLNPETRGSYSEALAERVFSVENEAERHRIERSIIKDYLSAGLSLLPMLGEKTLTFWGEEDNNWAFTEQETRIVPLSNRPLGDVLTDLRRTERLYFAMICLLGIASIVVTLRKKEANTWLTLCGLMTVVFFCSYIFIETQPRYRYLLYPFLFLLTSGALQSLTDPNNPLFSRNTFSIPYAEYITSPVFITCSTKPRGSYALSNKCGSMSKLIFRLSLYKSVSTSCQFPLNSFINTAMSISLSL